MERCPKCGWFHTDECMTSGHNNSHNPAKTRTPILISARSMKMPKMPEVTMHVTTEPDPQEAREYKASADMWAEQCRTLQRTLLDTQIERDALRVQLKRAQQGLGEDITRPHDGPEICPTYYDVCNCTVEVLVFNIDRAEKAEARVAELEGVISKTIDAINSQSPKPRMSIHARAMLNKLRDTLTP